ncbi:MAG: hypothetical protein QOG38_3183 [Hyphomicrobiales bacterium]|nr:hypothetical protein [Hyphomicrobiales bacterium]
MKQPFLINLAAAVAALVLPIALASLAVQQSPPPDFSAADDASIHSFGDTDKTCLEWTDACRTCLRVANTAMCPNIGIACQPKPITCVRREEPPKPAEQPKPPEAAPK